MSEKHELYKNLSVLSPGTHTFTVGEILYVSDGDWNSPDYGNDVIFKTTDGKTVIISEEELLENNGIVSRYDIDNGMMIKKIVPEGNTSLFGFISQTYKVE